MPTVVVDVETTGLGHHGKPKRLDAVIQIGLAWRENGAINTWSSLANPGPQFLADGRADAALSINHISMQAIQDAPPIHAVAHAFWNKVYALEAQGDMVSFRSFNRAFDAAFLAQDPWNVPDQRWQDCIMLSAQNHFGFYKWPKLQEATNRLGISWPDGPAHDAAVDAHAALLVHEKITAANPQTERLLLQK